MSQTVSTSRPNFEMQISPHRVTKERKEDAAVVADFNFHLTLRSCQSDRILYTQQTDRKAQVRRIKRSETTQTAMPRLLKM